MKKEILTLSLILMMIFGSFSLAMGLCVISEEANLRSGPGTNYDKNWQVFKYMPLKKIKKKGKWYKVKDVDGDVHWIYGKLVTDKIKCAVVKVDKANVRKGPGTNYPKTDFSPAIKYDSFKVLKKKGPWYKLVDEFGQVGWIHKKLLWVQ
ncbi:MAG: SH3 domain-containing protein [Nitrospirae bacterium]|nr:SH3 domain-containing protein [Nitrospirota bacterium]